MGNPSTDKVAWPLTSRLVYDPPGIRFRASKRLQWEAYGSVRRVPPGDGSQRTSSRRAQRARADRQNPRAFVAGCVYSAMDAVSGEELAHETAPMGYVLGTAPFGRGAAERLFWGA